MGKREGGRDGREREREREGGREGGREREREREREQLTLHSTQLQLKRHQSYKGGHNKDLLTPTIIK